jgi:ribonuclease III
MKSGSDAALAAVERRIGYTFDKSALLRTALTHASAASPSRGSYQRFEFLGDRVLGLVISEMLIEMYPRATEGELSHRLAELVRKEACAEVAAKLDLGGGVTFGGSRAQRTSLLTINVLGDVCEAVIGAIYLDGGLEAARTFIGDNWREKILAWPGLHRNAKVTLQEWAQSKGMPVPDYSIVAKSGPDHEPHFEVEAIVETLAPARGAGRTRREAEQAAAGALLLREGVWKAEE